MQHSLVCNFSSHHSRGLARLRQQCRALNRHAVRLAASGGLARGTAAVVLASAAAGPPNFGRDSSQPQQQQQQQQQSKRGVLDFGSPLRRCTDSLLVLNLLLFAANWASKDVLLLWGAKVNGLIAAGQVWRLFTGNFLHTNLMHLLINSYSLNAIGPHAELLLGHKRFLAVYTASAVLGTVASYLLTPAPSVGASAALFGLGASLGVFYWRHRHSMGRRSEVVLQQLGVTLAINMAYSMMSKRIDNWGHMGGMLGGAVVTWLLGPHLVRDNKSGAIVDRPPLPLLAHKPLHGPTIK